MDENTIDSSFCFKYLSNFVGLRRSTIDLLLANDYDSIQSLMALDIDIDLNQLSNISMGQKSILREALIKLKKEFNVWIESESKTDPSICQTFINSTPKLKEYPFVNNNQSFQELITTVMIDITGGPNVSSSPNRNSFNSPMNGIDSQMISLSPRKRGRPSTQNKNKRSLQKSEETASDQKPKLNLNLNQTKPKRRKKFLYSLKSCRNRNQNNSTNNKTDCHRKVFIDIDKHSQMNESIEETISKYTEYNQRSDELIVKPKDLKAPKMKSNKNKLKSDVKSEDLMSWKTMKPQLIELIKNKSKQIKLKKDEKLKGMNDFFKIVELKGKSTPFVVCDLCMARNDFRLFRLRNSSCLRNHLLTIRHQNDPLVSDMFGTTISKEKLPDDSDLSVEEFDGDIQSEMDTKTVVKQLPKKQQLAQTSELQLSIKKININFDESKGRYLADLLDTESQTSSQIIVNNYLEVFHNENKIMKPYKCQINGCLFSTAYPFSLDQHFVRRHQLKNSAIKKMSNSATKTTKKKSNSFNVLKGMNNYVLNYLKNKSSNEDSDKEKDDNSSSLLEDNNKSMPLVCQSPNSEYSSDCLTNNKFNIDLNDTNEQRTDNNINDKIVTKIKTLVQTNVSFTSTLFGSLVSQLKSQL